MIRWLGGCSTIWSLTAALTDPAAKTTVTVFPEGDLQLKLLDATGSEARRTADVPLAAVSDPRPKSSVADASPANLEKLAAAPGG